MPLTDGVSVANTANGSDLTFPIFRITLSPLRPARTIAWRIAVNNDIVEVRQIKPSDRKATCLLAEGRQITLTRDWGGSKHATAASGISAR